VSAQAAKVFNRFQMDRECSMNYVKAAMGALAIMMASGMIADFDVSERDDDLYITVWSTDDQPVGKLRKHVAAMLPSSIGETRIVVVSEAAA
jgi:hypothetical protein